MSRFKRLLRSCSGVVRGLIELNGANWILKGLLQVEGFEGLAVVLKDTDALSGEWETVLNLLGVSLTLRLEEVSCQGDLIEIDLRLKTEAFIFLGRGGGLVREWQGWDGEREEARNKGSNS